MNLKTKERSNTLTFKSKSNPGKQYETILYMDGTVSCNCPGWIFNRNRVCRHTKLMGGVAAVLEVKQS